MSKRIAQIISSPIGELLIAAEGDYLVELRLPKLFKKENYILGNSSMLERTAKQLEEYFVGKRKDFDIPLKLYGTDFQKQTWEALISVPYGKTASYKDIAIQIGSPKACRAVGGANNKNPIAIIVPCHRIVGANSKLVGYAGGLDIKTMLLDLEKSNSQ
ncbi:MAG: methylated-DNA--[protein]-cysteine S-methyltransferase [Pseudomonadales bacterium]|jgi:methylated-DNA-[protein]-cysteine S-methyltransferase|nr:methylated-DNA--[protein]-cysteine S-methyltransferase [Pseudomonadales bacterium]